MDLSIIIVSWNVKEFLKKCLLSIYGAAKQVSFEVFIVDNASTDDSRQMVLESFPQVRLIANNENLGFARANNEAIKRSSGRYVLILNPDTEINDAAFFRKTLSFMESSKDIGILAPKLVYPDGREQESATPPFSILSFLMDEYLPCKGAAFRRYRPGEVKGHFNPMGACLLIRREVFERIGYFDEAFFVSLEDVDFTQRARKAGVVISNFADTEVVHHRGASSSKDYWRWVECHYASLAHIVKKYYGSPGLYFLAADSLIQRGLAFFIFPFLHLLFGRPRDAEYLKRRAAIRWSQVAKALWT